MKIKILIASFLKPVDDIRSYQKIAKSLAQNQTYDIYCTGYPSNIELSDNNVNLFPLSSLNKNNFGRLIAQWSVLKYYLKVKPQLIIVNSPDLLIITSFYRILFGSKIIYDIQENYFRNLWYQNNYLWGIRHALALIIRSIELITSPLFFHFILAEKIYTHQLKFIKSRYTVIENKSLTPSKTNVTDLDKNNITFFIGGTIAMEYGIYEGLDFFMNVLELYPKAQLKIIGHCPNNSLYKSLQNKVKYQANIQLEISRYPVPHKMLESKILKSTIGLLPYVTNKSTEGKWPTKLYEYAAYHLPFIIQDTVVWNDFVLDSNAGVIFEFNKQTKENCQSVLSTVLSKSFNKSTVPFPIYWQSEEAKLLKLIDNSLETLI